MQPELFGNVDPRDVELFGKVIERYWAQTDAWVGEILSYYENTPTLVLVVSDHGAGPAVGAYKIITPEHLHLSGSHRLNGMMIANGPGIRSGEALPDTHVYDIAPTLLAYLGLPVGDDMDGKVLTSMFTPSLARRAVSRVATHDDPADVKPEHVESPVDDEALEHLRSLGYIE
jgi:predicted AlkP superfamily phosphohydrolase/phosphomutase